MPVRINLGPLRSLVAIGRAAPVAATRRLLTSAPQKWDREYFYHVDCHGQLFLEDITHKNFTTCFKNREFLNFFYARLQPNTIQRSLDRDGKTVEYPFISPCGREMNFVTVEDSPIVFYDIDMERDQLKWGGSFESPFEPAVLYLSNQGRLYHPSPKAELYTVFQKEGELIEYPPLTLIRSSVVSRIFGESMDWENLELTWKGKVFPVKTLPW
ncbi:uncharacterized protein BJ171DRAFT_486898 [Polychytrium aggregatum]|uniref:uncharacterized protein n=1 Tax=Polychytrium aggregatum TaxID=110093 RepID=UPI0022FF3C31|nr:uncharacterized protein BJ171DRAFT_486898 [Polychytrium aggregatum]KAI9209404.1 hypothetical protein BJ171DRAFT_486898 [Polychytrium aggregatum]